MKNIFPNCDEAEKYAKAVIAEKIPASKWVVLACKRQVADLKRVGKPAFPYVYEKSFGEKVCVFVQEMPHVKGIWAKKKENIKLAPWQKFIICTTFGWVYKPGYKIRLTGIAAPELVAGLRRFRFVYLELPRKNAKSTLTAAIANYMLTQDGEAGAEVYSGATTEKQGRIIFDIAKAMAARNKDFRNYYGVEVNVKNMNVALTGSKFEPVCAVADSNEGLNPHFGVLDELHAHRDRTMHDVFELGMGSRSQPMIWEITTSGDNLAGICYEQHSYVKQLLEGVFKDESFFGLIYCADLDDDWRKESTWKKANPNYGISVSPRDMKALAKKAARSATTLRSFKIKRLDLWLGSTTTWLDLAAWDKCRKKLPPLETLRARRCWLGVDLATKLDIASVVVLVENEHGGVDWYEKHFCPREKIYDETGIHTKKYAGWADEGYMNLSEGNVIDFNLIKEFVIQLNENMEIVEVGYDPWQCAQLANDLQEDYDIVMVEIRPGVKTFSGPMKELHAMVVSEKIRHIGNPVTKWMIANVEVRLDFKDNIYPRKALNKPENKIDVVVAGITAMNRFMMRDIAEEKVYPATELLTV